MSPFNHFTACVPDFSGTQENTARRKILHALVPEIIRQICTAYTSASPPPGVQYIAVRGN